MELSDRLTIMADSERDNVAAIRLRDLANQAKEQERERDRLRSLCAELQIRMTRLRAQAEAPQRQLQDDVRAAHVRLGSQNRTSPILSPLDRKTLLDRAARINEEHGELLAALWSGSLTGIAQEGVDLVYTVLGLFVETGVRFQPVWDLVHAANMQKVGSFLGKWQKPDGWRKPDVEGEIERQKRCAV